MCLLYSEHIIHELICENPLADLMVRLELLDTNLTGLFEKYALLLELLFGFEDSAFDCRHNTLLDRSFEHITS